ncbi:hypothetical protein PYCCODRAFT_1425667 [Trametes coccinea BRFM310]|uniref:Uncharacterized protein n=1 Tax=Trametes coccinea (strain BRFM310) TaxID=1353009 RepID=A0A1Y2ILJ6_TRAC3|nr:hypothetical protein PYCCODRAFT_1425667 [Trametes coccinea BRFM310]
MSLIFMAVIGIKAVLYNGILLLTRGCLVNLVVDNRHRCGIWHGQRRVHDRLNPTIGDSPAGSAGGESMASSHRTLRLWAMSGLGEQGSWPSGALLRILSMELRGDRQRRLTEAFAVDSRPCRGHLAVDDDGVALWVCWSEGITYARRASWWDGHKPYQGRAHRIPDMSALKIVDLPITVTVLQLRACGPHPTSALKLDLGASATGPHIQGTTWAVMQVHTEITEMFTNVGSMVTIHGVSMGILNLVISDIFALRSTHTSTLDRSTEVLDTAVLGSRPVLLIPPLDLA